jgi:hypothetical protein
MSLDSQEKEPVLDEEVLDPGTEETASSEEDKENEDEGFDFDSLKQELSTVRTQEPDRFERINRQLGHVSSLQKKVTELEKRLSEDSGTQALRRDMDILMDAIADLLPDERRAPLAQSRQERLIEQEVSKRLPKQGVETRDTSVEFNPQMEALLEAQERLNRQYVTASQKINEYAAKKGVSLSNEDFLSAQNEAGQFNVEGAVERMIKLIDSRSPTTKADRRAERKEAATGGAKGEKDGSAAADLSTLTGIIKAKQKGLINNQEFYEKYVEIKKEMGI